MTLLWVLLGWTGLSVLAALLWCALCAGAKVDRRRPEQASRPEVVRHLLSVPPQRRWDDWKPRQDAAP